MSKRARKLHRISKRLKIHQLRRLPEKDLTMGFTDLFNREGNGRSSPYFLGFYSSSGIQYALEKYGFFKFLKEKGYENIKLTINTKDPFKQRVAIYYETEKPENLLVELVVKRKHITIHSPFPSTMHGRNYEVIAVEWLLMQNPKGKFSSEKPRLPGQKYPGLGIGDMTMEILVIMSGRLRTAGLLNRPEHFHNAQIYSSQFRFIDPVDEAKRRAISRDLLPYHSLSVVSWAIDLKCVTENGKRFEWHGTDQIIPIDRDLKGYFHSRKYKRFVEELSMEYHYKMDKSLLEKKMNEIKILMAC